MGRMQRRKPPRKSLNRAETRPNLRQRSDQRNSTGRPTNFLRAGSHGRNSMRIERPQTLVTKNVNDAISLLGDGAQYQKVEVVAFRVGDEECLRAKFNVATTAITSASLMWPHISQGTFLSTARFLCRRPSSTLRRQEQLRCTRTQTAPPSAPLQSSGSSTAIALCLSRNR